MEDRHNFTVYNGDGIKKQTMNAESLLGVDRNTFPSNLDYTDKHNFEMSVEKKRKIKWIFEKSLDCLKRTQRFMFPAIPDENSRDSISERKKTSEVIEKHILKIISEIKQGENILLANNLFKEIKNKLEKLSNFVNNFSLVQRDELSTKRSKVMRSTKRELDDDIRSIVHIYLKDNNISIDEYERVVLEFYT